ncbi:cell-envelope stress modulator CpxP [Serratia sp. UGAL515B_01]|uniref:cell-envelope stress modulator CpxP n=1 Tax=Serratia sp. UGAL515B_01 TaxID=2986763 RepID=UPI002953341E|nr:cell-envelope stress modulator CpxP [Serratia sp. UGAL515B_01]WON77007.1 cell-envelope stress modulator CpxP [Serratia sp. UGAL515B_01]
MLKVAMVVIASVLAMGYSSAFAANTTPETVQSPALDPLREMQAQQHMFDGVTLTEQQRQQMRDLMRRARHHLPGVNVAEIEAMHKLVTADEFNEAAVYAQAEKMAQEQVKLQVEMARVRNQMYNLLTPEQKNVLDHKHQQRMQQMEQQTSAQKFSITE